MEPLRLNTKIKKMSLKVCSVQKLPKYEMMNYAEWTWRRKKKSLIFVATRYEYLISPWLLHWGGGVKKSNNNFHLNNLTVTSFFGLLKALHTGHCWWSSGYLFFKGYLFFTGCPCYVVHRFTSCAGPVTFCLIFMSWIIFARTLGSTVAAIVMVTTEMTTFILPLVAEGRVTTARWSDAKIVTFWGRK